MDNPEKLATLGAQDDKKTKQNKNNMCWTPQYASKHK